MNRTLTVMEGDPRAYPLWVTANGLEDLPERLAAVVAPGSRLIVITDTQLADLHLATLQDHLKTYVVGQPVIIRAGESSKAFATLERVVTEVLDQRPDRRTVLVAFGGGVVGDLAGFVASIVLRGLPFVQIPTTLLAQVDSSVGGKTGINTAHGKNLVGSFYQPKAVFISTILLDTLPRRALLAGYAEVVKYGLLGDADFFHWLEQNGPLMLDDNGSARVEAIARSCQAKADIVTRDEREAGVRALLNLGHTFGHALEALAGYDGSLLHGEAVSIGMRLAFDLSVRMELCPAEDAIRVRQHLSGLGLPVDIPAALHRPDDILAAMAHDKKKQGDHLTFILAHSIGRAFITTDVETSAVMDVLREG